jgi:hypothetical protein
MPRDIESLYDMEDDGITRLIEDPIMLGNLWGEDGNAWFIMSKVAHCIKESGYSREVVAKYNDAAMSGDYMNLLIVTNQTVRAFWLDGFTVRPLVDYMIQYKARVIDKEED